jgi:hypothetical protein
LIRFSSVGESGPALCRHLVKTGQILEALPEKLFARIGTGKFQQYPANAHFDAHRYFEQLELDLTDDC